MVESNPLPPLDVPALPRAVFAGAWRRLIAFAFDCIVVMPTALLISWPLGTLPFLFDRSAETVGVFELAPRTARLITNAVTILLYDIYFAGTVSRAGSTLGMHLFGVEVVDRVGGIPTKRMARWRYFGASLALLPAGLGLLAMLWDGQRRGWHDRMARTWAVHRVVLMRHAQAHGIERKFNAPITTGVLLFLPGLPLAAAALIVFVYIVRAWRWVFSRR